jgi:hypothetical protein
MKVLLNRVLGPILALALLASALPARALDVDEIVARHTQALGGEENINKLKSLRLVGKVTFGSGDFSIDLIWTTLF